MFLIGFTKNVYSVDRISDSQFSSIRPWPMPQATYTVFSYGAEKKG